MTSTDETVISHDNNSIFTELIPRIGFIRDLIGLGQTGSNLGFNAASTCTEFGFRIARSCLTTPADIVDNVLGCNELSNVLRSVHTTVGAAEAVALTSILMAHSAAALSLTAADATLELTGAPRREGFIWQQIRTAVPCRFADYTPVIQAIAETILTFVAPVKSLTPSQLREAVVAFALLQQANRRRAVASHFSVTEDNALPADFVRCMGFAAAAYGNMAMNFLEFIPRGLYQSDTLPHLVPGVRGEDVIRRGQDIAPFTAGFLLLADHHMQTIVLAVRGSFHLNDLITDLTCKLVDCKSFFPGVQEASCHEGFLLAARALDSLLREDVEEALRLNAGYSLLLCGHSLGAGVASVLAALWQNVFHNVGMRCVALAPPCVFTLDAARDISRVVTSVVVGDDIVSRLSVSSAHDLRDACLHLFQSSVDPENGEVSAYDENKERLSAHITGSTSDSEVVRYQYTSLERSEELAGVEMFEYSQYTVLGKEGERDEVEKEKEHERQLLRDLGHVMTTLRTDVMNHTKLYPPGRIVHIIDKRGWEECNERATGCHSLEVVSEDQNSVAYLADQLTFSELQLSGSMFSSHMPTACLYKLRDLFPLTS